MAIEQMQRINLCAMKTQRKAILNYLQRLGAVEIHLRLDEDVGYEKEDVERKKSEYERQAHQTNHALEILQAYAPEKKGMLDGLSGKTCMDRKTFEAVMEKQEHLIEIVEQILTLDRKMTENAAKLQNIRNQIEILKPWMSLDVPMNFKGTKKTTAFIGTLPGDIHFEAMRQEFLKIDSLNGAVDGLVISKDKDFQYVFILCLTKDAPMVEDALRSFDFARPTGSFETTPRLCKEALQREMLKLKKENEDFKETMVRLSDERERLQILADGFRMKADRCGVVGKLPQTKYTFLLSGYIPKERAKDIADTLMKDYDAVAEIEGVTQDEEIPVLLKNGRLAESGEGVLTAFGLPAKGELDPTAIMTAFYVFLFGLMLADVAYGLIISIACGVMLKKFPRMEENLKKSLKLFFLCGLSTTFWGIMFGGFFGDAIQVISKNFFGHELSVPALWFVPINEPMRMLLWSMIFGMLHMYTGLALKAYICMKNKRYLDALCDVGFWALLLTGLILMLIPSDLFASMFQITVKLPTAVQMLARAMAILGALGILLMSGRDKKGKWGIRLALGAYDLYNITSWLSDALSYSRLLALGLATGVIASVFNQMGSMFGNGIFGTLIFILVFIVGHTFNLALNLLGTYVHTCRLQYIEFFGKFYEGGGKAFHPFRANTKYIDIKEEV